MLNRKKTQRTPEQVLKLYDWLWLRLNKGQHPPQRPVIIRLNLKTLTGRCIVLLSPQMERIHKFINSDAYRRAARKIIRSYIQSN